MRGRGSETEGGVKVDGHAPEALVEELGRRERDAIAESDWERLDEILEEQRTLWRRLTDLAGGDAATAPAEVAAALKLLYRVRRQNHALIQRSFAEVRRQLATAHAGSGARSAYREASGRAA